MSVILFTGGVLTPQDMGPQEGGLTWDIRRREGTHPHPLDRGSQDGVVLTPRPPGHRIQWDRVDRRAVRILLKCFLVTIVIYG